MFGKKKDYRQSTIEHIDKTPLPPIGDPNKTYPIVLTEPEINAIHSAMGFVRSACATAPFPNYWKHYGPTLENLSNRLAEFDDK